MVLAVPPALVALVLEAWGEVAGQQEALLQPLEAGEQEEGLVVRAGRQTKVEPCSAVTSWSKTRPVSWQTRILPPRWRGIGLVGAGWGHRLRCFVGSLRTTSRRRLRWVHVSVCE